MPFHLISFHMICCAYHLLKVRRSYLFTPGILLSVLICAPFLGDSWGRENEIFQQFTQHIGRQIQKDKQAFAQANHCVSWFYKAKKTPPAAVQGISWKATPLSRPALDCSRDYPGGMADARNDLAKTQASLSSVSPSTNSPWSPTRMMMRSTVLQKSKTCSAPSRSRTIARIRS